MENKLPFFNWSLRKAQDALPDSFDKAKVGIMFIIIVFSLLKVVIAMGVTLSMGQWMQFPRALVAFALYVTLLKIILYKPTAQKTIAHVMLVAGILLICSNIFVYSHTVNLVTIQFIFMVVVCSFYTLGNKAGIIYSIVSMTPVIAFLIFKGNTAMYMTTTPEEFPSPGYEIIVVLNFITIIIVHYLFFEAFRTNIKEKEQLNEQLQLSLIEANRLAESKSNFLSTMSHELRTPLNSVIGVAELLLDDNPEERQKENLKVLHYSALDLLSLINNILDFNKFDSDKVDLESINFWLAEFIHNICGVLRVKASTKKIDLLVEIAPELEKVLVMGDPTRLSQIMYNLVGNAIKFTEKGKITVNLSIANKADSTVGVLFSITDSGIGIHPDQHEVIFDLFSQAGTDMKRRYGGTGLGLAIVKQALKLFNSEIYLQSTPGKGSKFYFTIQFTVVHEPASVLTTPEADHTPDLNGLKVLVAEDNELNRLILSKQLSRLNVDSVMMKNGVEVCAALLSDDFDTILMDLHMPEMDGYEAVRKIRSLADRGKARIPIIAFTASVTEQHELTEGGFDDFLHKPVNMRDLANVLERISEKTRT